jgi:hypothetical protein
MMMLNNLDAMIIDVETAFLEGVLDVEIYMDLPKGLEEDPSTECVKLEKAVYGVVQAARQYYKTFIGALRSVGFVGGYADPCLMMRKDHNGVVYVGIWVDDSLIVGDTAAIQATVRDLQETGFKLKTDGTLEDYLSCNITFDREKKNG